MSEAIKTIQSAIAQKVTEAAQDQSVPLSPAAAKPVSDALTASLGPWILSMTNNEPWYQSKIVWGLVLAGAGTITKPVMHLLGYSGDLIAPDRVTEWVEALATLGQFVGIAFAAYVRLTSKGIVPKI